jgi:hypothetical protein
MTISAKSWLVVRVTRQDDSEVLHVCPGREADLDLLAIFAWVTFPDAKEIWYKDQLLENPLKSKAGL